MSMKLDVSEGLKVAFDTTKRICQDYNNRYILLEHLLCALLENELIIDLIEDCNVDVEQLFEDISGYLSTEVESLQVNQDLEQGPGINRVLEMASRQAVAAGRNIVDCANVLVAIFTEEKKSCSFFP